MENVIYDENFLQQSWDTTTQYQEGTDKMLGYFADNKGIECCDYDGQNRAVFVEGAGDAYDVKILDNFLYWIKQTFPTWYI